MRRPGAALLLAAAAVIGLAACDDPSRGPRVSAGSRDRGKEAMVRYGCGSCHVIPGVPGADGLVAPPLSRFGRRSFIGGQLGNTPENLARWIQDPQSVEPGTAMPDLDVSADEARDIAAYLESLD